MSNDRPEPNELAAGFEPLRVAFAVGALLLGILVVFANA